MYICDNYITMKKIIINLLWIVTFLMIVMVLVSWIVLMLTVEMLFIFATVPYNHPNPR